MKKLKFENRDIDIKAPELCTFQSRLDESLYNHIYSLINDGDDYKPILNSDIFSSNESPIDLIKLHKESKIIINLPSKKATNFDKTFNQFIVRDFFSRYPAMMGLVYNNVGRADISIANAGVLFGHEVDASNFIKIKSIIDTVNSNAWSREKDKTESQSGVSTLGTISETLIEKAVGGLVDQENFFHVGQSEVQSYGDFVLMCLPNNLWLSVKSNFSRERLLASGYTNDILGVGFFQDPTEFTSPVRVRNFQRAGFLAIYCPDVAVNENQLKNNTSTYAEIVKSYANEGYSQPTNINGKPFIRKLSCLKSDLDQLLEQKDIRKRSTVAF